MRVRACRCQPAYLRTKKEIRDIFAVPVDIFGEICYYIKYSFNEIINERR